MGTKSKTDTNGASVGGIKDPESLTEQHGYMLEAVHDLERLVGIATLELDTSLSHCPPGERDVRRIHKLAAKIHLTLTLAESRLREELRERGVNVKSYDDDAAE